MLQVMFIYIYIYMRAQIAGCIILFLKSVSLNSLEQVRSSSFFIAQNFYFFCY